MDGTGPDRCGIHACDLHISLTHMFMINAPTRLGSRFSVLGNSRCVFVFIGQFRFLFGLLVRFIDISVERSVFSVPVVCTDRGLFYGGVFDFDVDFDFDLETTI